MLKIFWKLLWWLLIFFIASLLVFSVRLYITYGRWHAQWLCVGLQVPERALSLRNSWLNIKTLLHLVYRVGIHASLCDSVLSSFHLPTHSCIFFCTGKFELENNKNSYNNNWISIGLAASLLYWSHWEKKLNKFNNYFDILFFSNCLQGKCIFSNTDIYVDTGLLENECC